MSVAMVDHDASAKFCAYADPGIKLFGRDIPLKQELSEEPSSISTVQIASHQDDQADSLPQIIDCKEPMEIFTCKSEDVSCIEVGNGSVGSTSVKMEEARVKSGFSTHDSLHKAQDIHGSVLQERTTKKPDKLLPCPRCDSLDTKFCYFNNYNVNQPRHFCRKCQRYWTAGGTLRNVPVGAGRRKNKHSALHQKHTMVSDASPVRARTDDVARHSFGSTSTTVCTALGSFPKPSPSLHVLPLDAQPVPTLDSPLCQSMAVTTLGMQQTGNLQHHGDAHLEGAIPVATKFDAGGGFTAKPRDCTSPVEVLSPSCHANLPLSSASIATTSSEGQQTNNSGCGSEQVQSREITAPSVHGATWQSGTNMMGESAFSLATCPPPNGENTPNSSFSILQPNIFACSNGAPGPFWPGFSWPFMNPAVWGAPPLEWAGPWTMPVYPPGAAAAAAAAAACVLPYSFAGGSPQKHQVIERSQPEKCLWVPKTLRIGDPLNAARSSIWTTLGLGDGPLSSPAHGPTIAFQAKADSKDDDENEAVSTNRMSNPAALSRSAAFQENS